MDESILLAVTLLLAIPEMRSRKTEVQSEEKAIG